MKKIPAIAQVLLELSFNTIMLVVGVWLIFQPLTNTRLKAVWFALYALSFVPSLLYGYLVKIPKWKKENPERAGQKSTQVAVMVGLLFSLVMVTWALFLASSPDDHPKATIYFTISWACACYNEGRRLARELEVRKTTKMLLQAVLPRNMAR